MKEYVLAIDQGTTSTRVILFDECSKVVAIENEEITQYYPQPGWVEQDAEEIWQSVISTVNKALVTADIKPNQIKAIGITNQRETTIVWDKKTGKPIYHAVVWQSRQTSHICEQLKKDGYEDLVHKKTGLLIDPYFSGTKVKWILDHTKGAREKANAGELAFGTVDSWLIYKLTGGNHKTDYSNASRTLMYNIHELKWDDELLEILDVPKSMLPDVCDSSGIFGYTNESDFLGVKIPISGVAGDQQASLFGQLCCEKGMVNSTYGTGCFVLMNTGSDIVESNNGMLSTIAWKVKDKLIYALEGSVFVGGSCIQWLRDGLKIIKSADETEKLAKSVETNDGVYFVPAFVGLGTPHWDSEAKGAIFGLTRGTDERQIARSALESICYQVLDVLSAMERDGNHKIPLLKANGGATRNNYLMQFQSDILQMNVNRSQIMETTALGAAYLAGLAVGFWDDIDEIKAQRVEDEIFEPKMDPKRKDKLIHNWNIAVEATKLFKI